MSASNAPVQTASSAGKKRKPHRWRPGTVALREIRHLQKNTDRVLPQLSVERLIREIAKEVGDGEDMRFQKDALLAIQEGAEEYLVDMFKSAQKFAIHSNRQTVDLKDIELAQDARTN